MSDKQKAYLRQHEVAVLLDDVVREMLEVKPAKPFGFILGKLKEAEAKMADGVAKTEVLPPTNIAVFVF